MDNKKIARELVKLAKELVSGKGEVPEAFKKQWKKNEEKGDSKGKDKKDKPDFVKKIEEKKDDKPSKGKGEVPEAFKKQWKKNDKKAVVKELLVLARKMIS